MYFRHLRNIREKKLGDEQFKQVCGCSSQSSHAHTHTHTHHAHVQGLNLSFSRDNDFQELQKLRRWIDDDPKLFVADVLLSLLLSYRDIQVHYFFILPRSLHLYVPSLLLPSSLHLSLHPSLIPSSFILLPFLY